jgi:excisionase family DNA binding protein
MPVEGHGVRPEVPVVPAPDFLSVREAACVLRIGKTCAYELAEQFLHTEGAPGLRVIRVGRQLRVPRTALEEMLGGPITWPPSSTPDPVDPLDAPESEVAAPIRPRTRRKTPEQPQQLFAL